MAEPPRACGSFTIADGHPSLPGHFPGDPIVPGVVLIDHALELLQAAYAGQTVQDVRAVRFRQVVRAGQPIAVQARPGGQGAVDFTGSFAGAVVFSGSVGLAPP